MATTKTSSNDRAVRAKPSAESPREITNDLVEYLIDYARQNPGYVAMYCLGIGFVLGWKLKLW